MRWLWLVLLCLACGAAQPPVPAADGGACRGGDPCVPNNPCHQGATSCVGDVATCIDTGRLDSGDPQCSLLAYWPLDASGADATGGRALVLHGGLSFAAGLLGGSLDLQQVPTQYATRPAGSGDDELDFYDEGDFTIQVWVYFNKTPDDMPAVEQTFVEKFDGRSGNGWTLTKLEDGRLHFFCCGLFLYHDPRLIQLTEQRWHHVVARRAGPQVQLFLDGQPVAAGALTRPPFPTEQPLLIGKRNDRDGRDFPFNGRIDEIAVWRRGLQLHEIQQLYNNGAGLSARQIP